MGHDPQDAGHQPHGESAPIALAQTEIDRVGVHGREQEDEGPVPGVLRVVDVEAADRQQGRSEERGPGAGQAPADEVQQGDGEHAEQCRQYSQPELIQRREWLDQVVVEQVYQRPGIVGPELDRVPEGEHLGGLETPGAEPVKAQGEAKQDQTDQHSYCDRPVSPVGFFGAHQPPRRSRMTGRVFSMMRKSSLTDWRRMYSRS